MESHDLRPARQSSPGTDLSATFDPKWRTNHSILGLRGHPTLDERHIFAHPGEAHSLGMDPLPQFAPLGIDPLAEVGSLGIDPSAQASSLGIDPLAEASSLGIDPSAEFTAKVVDSQTDRVVGLLACVGQGVDPLVHVASKVADAP